MFLQPYKTLPKNRFVLLFWNVFGLVATGYVVVGFLALFGVQPVKFNGAPTFGVLGFLAALVIGPLMSLLLTITIWLIIITGNFILRMVLKLFGH